MNELPDALQAWFPDAAEEIGPQHDPTVPDMDQAMSVDPSPGDGAAAVAADRDMGPLAEAEAPSGTKRALLVIGVAALVLWSAVVIFAEVAAPAAPALETTPAGDDPAAPAAAHTDTIRAAAATAVLAVHDAVAGNRRWVDAAAVDHVTLLRLPDGAEVPGEVADASAPREALRTVFVVAVQASLLEGDGTAWDVRRRARYAVPVWCSERRCAEAAEPWPLPAGARPGDDSPSPSSGPPTGESPASDGYAAALRAAGYRQIDVRGTRALWPGATAVDVRARAPGESAQRDFVIWVTDRRNDAPARDGGVSASQPRVLGSGDDRVP